MTADALALLSPGSPDTWPQGILAAADLREQRAKAAQAIRPGPYYVGAAGAVVAHGGKYVTGYTTPEGAEVAEHIAAEANPAHALAAVRRWRGVVDRHARSIGERPLSLCVWCFPREWPCFDLTETADEARAYVSGGPE